MRLRDHMESIILGSLFVISVGLITVLFWKATTEARRLGDYVPVPVQKSDNP